MTPFHETFTDVLNHYIIGCTIFDNSSVFKDLKPIKNTAEFRQLLKEIADKTKEKGAYYDVFGEIFMEKMPRNSGQVFTPPHIAELMSEVVKQNETDPIILDSACGSGRLLLSEAKQTPNALFIGWDLDLTCVKMVVCNMLINSLRSEIIWGNSQTNEINAVFRTQILEGVPVITISDNI